MHLTVVVLVVLVCSYTVAVRGEVVTDDRVKADDERELWSKDVTKVSHIHHFDHEDQEECAGGAMKEGHHEHPHGHCMQGFERWTCRDNRMCMSKYGGRCEKQAGRSRVKHTWLCDSCDHHAHGYAKFTDCDTDSPKLLQCTDEDCSENCELMDAPKTGCSTDTESEDGRETLVEYHKCQAAVVEYFAEPPCDPYTLLRRTEHPAGPSTCQGHAHFQCINDPEYTPEKAEAQAKAEHDEMMKDHGDGQEGGAQQLPGN